MNERTDGAERREALERVRQDIQSLDQRRRDWERDSALFVPLRQRLDRGRSALELWNDYASLRELRQKHEQSRLEQTGLREDILSARTGLQGAEEAFSLMEGEFRERLTEQKRMAETVQKVQDLDVQLLDRQETASELQNRIGDVKRELKEREARVEQGQRDIEREGIALREARKYLQGNAIDERLITGLAGIQKCFGLFTQAKERREALKGAYARAIQKKQRAQSALNDRQMMFSDISHRFSIAEKDHERAQSFLESTLKGKTLSEWRGMNEQALLKLEAIEELSKKFREEQELRDRMRAFQERRRKTQQESRDLDIRDAAEMGKIEELQSEVQKLERRVSLLRRIEDLDAMRELLQEGVSCPLCGAITHPYVSGALVPDENQINDQLRDAQRALEELNGELTLRRTRSGLLSEELDSITQDEAETRQSLTSLTSEIGDAVSSLGLKFGTGVPPLEELDRVRQKAREQLQRARNVLDTAEVAEHDLRDATDELERIRENRTELTRYHQEALFQLQVESDEEGHLEAETRSQEESFNTIRRELISLLSPFGYKSIPDENPASVIEALANRAANWQEQIQKKEALERELAVSQASMATLKKELDLLVRERAELGNRLKTLEAERESLRQQRSILFADRDPKTEKDRMERDVEELRQQLETRREAKGEASAHLQSTMTALHDLETGMARRRERIQREEIAFGKRLLAAGFKNEDDFLSACLSDEERKDLQTRLSALTQTDLELTAAKENARALQMKLQQEEQESGPA